MSGKECNVERMRKYISLLRSGRFKQTKGSLIRVKACYTKGKVSSITSENCCLGVACAYAHTEGVELNYNFGKATRAGAYSEVDVDGTDFLPKRVQQFLGISEKNPLLHVPWNLRDNVHAITPTETASSLNDGFHFNFDQIADCFEFTYLPEDYAKNHQ